MLQHFVIENYALIRKLNIGFSGGFTVITGETGAGKTIIVGALSLILGQRADTKVLWDKDKKCVVEGIFNIAHYHIKSFFDEHDLDYDDRAILRREITPSGKSRAFINDTPVKLNQLRELGQHLVDIHSQNSVTLLNDANFQLAVVDTYANHNNLLEEYRHEYKAYLQLQRQLKELTEKEQESKSEQDYYQFLYDELAKADLKEGEQQEIESELELQNNAEAIKTALYSAKEELSNSENNITGRLSALQTSIDRVAEHYKDLATISQRLESSYIDLKDIASEIERMEEHITYDPGEIEKLSERLDLIYRLEQKHRAGSVDELIKAREELARKLSEISSLEDQIVLVREQIKGKREHLEKLASSISENRKKAIPSIEKELLNDLSQLGMPDAQFKIRQTHLDDFTSDGTDAIQFMFNANKGGELLEVSRIASGGELSRLMLSVKSLIAQRKLLPTIIFDEIDSGVSGDIAGKVGHIMNRMANDMQVIAISHLPQIAARGNTHFMVYKETGKNSTTSYIKQLNKDERVEEMAKMLSSNQLTEAAMETARELLKQ
ncbi:MAG: DNA repair protein RecN [Bacteroidales bacterium]|nr:DNA repair protein RecN [Bacteroidales bacterium]